MGEPRSPQSRYWRANLKLVALLLTVWFIVSYGCSILFVEQLNAFHIGGFPLGFWFAQQGSILVFILLILVYCLRMDRIDAAYTDEGEQVEP
jgi:putative solute:sodium symporter small subunit